MIRNIDLIYYYNKKYGTNISNRELRWYKGNFFKNIKGRNAVFYPWNNGEGMEVEYGGYVEFVGKIDLNYSEDGLIDEAAEYFKKHPNEQPSINEDSEERERWEKVKEKYFKKK